MAKTILLADDSMTIQKVVELTFMDQDFEVTAVSDGGAAIAALDQTQPDIVIADVHMPTADGYAVCRHSKSKHQGTPVLLLVGTFEQFDEQQARQAGADGHLKKPFDSQELLQKVESMVADSGSAPAPPAPDAQPELTTQPAAPEPAAAPPAPEPTSPAPPAPEPAAPAPPAAPEPAAPQPAAPQQSAPARDFTSPEPAPPAPQPAEQAAAAADIDDFTSPEPAPPSQDFTSPEPAAPAPEPAAATPATPAAPSPAETVAVSQPSTPEPGAADFAPSSAETRPRRAEAAAPADAGEAASAAGGNGDGSLSDEDVERIARKVVELAGGNVVKEIAWEVIPDLAEVVIRERIQELESEVD